MNCLHYTVLYFIFRKQELINVFCLIKIETNRNSQTDKTLEVMYLRFFDLIDINVYNFVTRIQA